MVHNEIIVPQRHPTWDKLLDHLSRQTVGLQVVNRRLELTRWICGLAMRPEERQPALLLIGPECSGKTTFHLAMELLLPNQSVLRYPPPSWKLNNDEWHDMLRIAWLLVVEGHPERFVSLFRHSKCRNGRFLKWLLTDDRPVDENLPNVQRFNVRLLATTIPRADLLRRLEDEREAFPNTGQIQRSGIVAPAPQMLSTFRAYGRRRLALSIFRAYG
jgi:energy-coupling factor transporter ATP-binding protein EcfA2